MNGFDVTMPERVAEQMQAAPPTGRRRKRLVYAPPTAEIAERVQALHDKGVSVRVLAKQFGLSWVGIYRIVGEDST